MIPAFNEARRLPSTLARLHQYLADQGYTWEIVVVSNGSTDATEDVVRQQALSMPGLRLISLASRGKGLASREGVLHSGGQVVFLCDADLSMPPECLSAFLYQIQSVDVVVGSREAPGSHRFHEPWHRHLMGRMYNWLVKRVAVKGIEDTQCGFKAFRRDTADRLFGHQTLVGFGFDVEILFLAQRAGDSISELPIDWYFDPDTRVRPGVDSLRMFWELLLVRVRAAGGHYRAARPAEIGEPSGR